MLTQTPSLSARSSNREHSISKHLILPYYHSLKYFLNVWCQFCPMLYFRWSQKQRNPFTQLTTKKWDICMLSLSVSLMLPVPFKQTIIEKKWMDSPWYKPTSLKSLLTKDPASPQTSILAFQQFPMPITCLSHGDYQFQQSALTIRNKESPKQQVQTGQQFRRADDPGLPYVHAAKSLNCCAKWHNIHHYSPTIPLHMTESFESWKDWNAHPESTRIPCHIFLIPNCLKTHGPCANPYTISRGALLHNEPLNYPS